MLSYVYEHYTLIQFVCYIIEDRYSSMNLHGLLHLPDIVVALGPLWAHSSFPFESANSDLLKLFHGTTCVEKRFVNVNSLFSQYCNEM